MSITVAFDLDGTLIDSVTHIHEAVSLALKELSLPAITVADTRSFVGHGLPPLLDKVLAHIDATDTPRAELHDRVMTHYTAIPNDPSSVYPGVITALDTLQARGLRMTICTNKPGAAAQTALRDTGLADYFDVVIAGDSLPTRKPDPAMLMAAIGEATRPVYVGDSEVDAETAKAAAIPFALYTEGYRKSPIEALTPSASFSDFADLPDIVANLTKTS